MACQVVSNQGEILRKGPWLEEEDQQLVTFVTVFGDRKWDFIATASGLKRSGKSCRLRWLNYLRPNLKRGHISSEEEQIIIQLHQLWGNKWAKIARRLPGRTDNEIKNYWRSHLRKKLQAQEAGNFEYKANTEQNVMNQKGHTSSWNLNMEDHDYKPVIDNNIHIGPTDSSLEQHDQLSKLTYLHSPYEPNWMPEFSCQQNGMKMHGDCGGFDSCFCYLMKWNTEDGDNGMWDSWGSLWT